MSNELVQFLRGRLDEDEKTARAATPGQWSADNEAYAESIHGPSNAAVVSGGRWGGEASVFESTEDALHIARHDPDRVLREVEAKRMILERFAELSGEDWKPSAPRVVRLQELRDSVRCLALPYADHPEYQDAWRP
ncbi:DUF6221 family protein [Streptomyces sp. NPDC088115]|uniref:DUF6221 family protein n=1 Tax=Streptomyces sp. NPDC088115 TaxID=3365824 RepID=UPI0037F8695F